MLSNEWILNNKISGIKLVFSLYATIKMMHGPINIRYTKYCSFTNTQQAIMLQNCDICTEKKHHQTLAPDLFSLYSGWVQAYTWTSMSQGYPISTACLVMYIKRKAQVLWKMAAMNCRWLFLHTRFTPTNLNA